jgi:hypothetical protein
MKAFEITWENSSGSPVTATVHAHTSVEAIWKFAFGLGQRLGLSGNWSQHKYISCEEVGTFAKAEPEDGVPPAERAVAADMGHQ